MRNKFLLFCLVLSMSAFAGERSAIDAAALAAQFMNQQVNALARKASVGASSMKLSHTRLKLNSTEPAFYVFNQTNNEGYVVVSADDRTEDVLMYSDKGTLDVEKVNPNLKFWLNRLQEEISAANDENTYTAAEKKARKATTATAISPLLGNIAWDQEAPYYNQCPYSYYDNTTRCLTGCVATAAAQIMRMWKYPAQGQGSKEYSYKDYKDENYTTYQTQSLSKDFSKVTFDWNNMLEQYGSSYTDAQANAVATLMSCCGIACEMEYGSVNTCGGSGSWTDEMGYGLKTYFGYNVGKMITNYASQKEYESDKGVSMKNIPAEWGIEPGNFGSYFDGDLEAGRPILMGGYSKSSGGHEFVCDGRDATGMYHINWGWSGESNNYCAITALKPSGTSYNFSSSVDAMIGLEPKDRKIDTVYVTGVTVSPTTLTLKQKEKSTLTATVAPSDATIKSVIWSSSNSSIATVDASGVVIGVAEGSVTITATTKDGSKKATCAVTVTNEVLEVIECDNYYYEFTSKCTTGSNTLGDYTWNISLQAGTIQNVDATKGQQLGSKNNPCGQASLTTSNPAECLISSIKVNASMGKDGDAKLAVYIDGTQIGSTQTLTTTATEYTFKNSAGVQGDVELRLTNTAKAMYIKTIEVNPEGEIQEGDTTVINLTNNTVRLYDLVESNQMYQFTGISDDNAYGVLVAIQNVNSLVGKVEAANLYEGEYTGLYQINGTDTTQINYDAFLGGNVTNSDGIYSADFNFQVDESVYVCHFEYSNPEFDPTKVDTIAGQQAALNFGYWDDLQEYGYKVFVGTGLDDNYIYQGFFLANDSIVKDSTQLAGTYTQDDMYEQGIYDAQTYNQVFDIYSSSITLTFNADKTYTITGTLLCYGNQTFVLNLTTLPVAPMTLTVVSDDETKGIVFGGGDFEAYTTTTIAASAYDGYKFKNWSDGNTASARQIMVESDTTLIAYFMLASEKDTVEVHDTTYVPVEIRDTTYVPVEVHDTTYVPVEIRDTTYVPFEVHDTTYVPVEVHDTTYVPVEIRDTAYVPVEVHDTTYVPVEIRDTAYVPVEVHDTTYVPIEVHDTTYIDVPVHDTTYINMIEVNSMNPAMGTAVIQVYAIPEEGYTFQNWSDSNTDNPRTVEASDTPQTFTAVFAESTSTRTSSTQEDRDRTIKRIIDGRLYIERNGVIYDATGNELK